MTQPREREVLTIRNAHLIFKNFAGEAKKYNQKGDRNFSIVLSEEDALQLQESGWNVKPLKKRDEEDPQMYHLKIAVNFENRPPRCWLVSSGGRNMLGEGLVGMLDQLESTKVDLTISAYNWEVNGNTGKKAYLQSIFYHMYEDELEIEYANVPQIAVSGGDMAPKELAAGPSYDYEGEVVDG